MNNPAHTVFASSPDWTRFSPSALWADIIAARRAGDDAAFFAARRAFDACATEAVDVIVSDVDGLSPVVGRRDAGAARVAEWIATWWIRRAFSFDAEVVRVERSEADPRIVEVRVVVRTRAGGEAEGTVTLRPDGEGGWAVDVDTSADLPMSAELQEWASPNLVELLRLSAGMDLGAGHRDEHRFWLAARRLETVALQAARGLS